uniref:Uncharacterized protein n=1 Tax=Rhizophora mucronata TaxID=61149 RepID=A0A2P2QVC4_RHIMU
MVRRCSYQEQEYGSKMYRTTQNYTNHFLLTQLLQQNDYESLNNKGFVGKYNVHSGCNPKLCEGLFHSC